MERKLASWRQRDRQNVPNTKLEGEAGPGVHDAKPPDHTVDSLGCSVVYEGERVDVDIIFVHGLRGHQKRTWTKNGFFWPKDSLPSTLPNVRVIMYGYDANFVSLLHPISINTVFEHSKNLVNDITGIREGIADRPILWVTHSLGGIICKDALEYSKQQLRTRPSICELFASTYGIIFLGTPHRGSALGTLGVIASRAVRAMAVVNSDSTLLRALEQNSEVLTRISDAFSRMLALEEVVVHSFAEELPMPGIGIVVTKESAYIGDAFERTSSIHGDHRDVCRFVKSSACQPELEKVLGSLKEMFEGARRALGHGDLPKETYIEHKLRTFPTRLEGVYDRLLRDMPDGAEDVLRWAVYAFRPLSVSELWTALNGVHNSPPKTPDLREIQSMVADIALYSPLIKIEWRPSDLNLVDVHSTHHGPDKLADLDQGPLNPSTRSGRKRQRKHLVSLSKRPAHLVHQTVKEFFLLKWNQNISENFTFPLSTRAAHTNLAIICVRHLSDALKSLSQKHSCTTAPGTSVAIGKKIQTKRLGRNAFTPYAATHWHQHSIHGDERNEELWTLTCALLTSPEMRNSRDPSFFFCFPKAPWLGLDAYSYPGAMPPLHLFVANSMKYSAKLWLEQSRGFGVDEKNYGRTALHLAVMLGDLENLRLLLSYGADAAILSVDFGIPSRGSLHLAVASDQATALDRQAVTSLLIDHGASIDGVDFNGDTPLVVATERQDVPVASILIKRGASCNAVSGTGEPVLIIACQWKVPDPNKPLNAARETMAFIDLLLTSGADVNCRDRRLRTPLHMAIHVRNIRIVNDLLERGANLEAVDYQGRTALHQACADHQIAIVEILLQRGADVDCRDAGSRTPLLIAAAARIPRHIVAVAARVATVKLLLDHGAAVDARDESGWTPYWAARMLGRPESGDILRILLAGGPDATSGSGAS